jgi:hypothetical protein
MTPPKQPKKRDYQQHGLTTLKKALASVGDMEHWLSEQGEVGQAAKAKRDRLIRDQGGASKISEGELMTIDGTITAFVIQQSIGRYIGNMECPVNKVKRALFPVVREWPLFFQAVRDGVKDLSDLRKNRPKSEPVSLPEYVKSKAPTQDGHEATNGQPAPAPTTNTHDATDTTDAAPAPTPSEASHQDAKKSTS